MSTDAHYHLRDIDIDLADLPQGLYTEIASLHGHIDPPPARPDVDLSGERRTDVHLARGDDTSPSTIPALVRSQAFGAHNE